VDACTVTALDAITAFAVPDPNVSSQNRQFFRVRVSNELLRRIKSPSLLRISYILLKPTLSAIDASHPKARRENVNAEDWCKQEILFQALRCASAAKTVARHSSFNGYPPFPQRFPQKS